MAALAPNARRGAAPAAPGAPTASTGLVVPVSLRLQPRLPPVLSPVGLAAPPEAANSRSERGRRDIAARDCAVRYKRTAYLPSRPSLRWRSLGAELQMSRWSQVLVQRSRRSRGPRSARTAGSADRLGRGGQSADQQQLRSIFTFHGLIHVGDQRLALRVADVLGENRLRVRQLGIPGTVVGRVAGVRERIGQAVIDVVENLVELRSPASTAWTSSGCPSA